MRKISNIITVIVCAAFITGCSAVSSGPVIPARNDGASTVTRDAPQEARAIAISTPPPTVNPCVGIITTCGALLRLDLPPLGVLTPASAIPGLHPADIQSAYKLPSSTNGAGQTIAIVVPYNDPTVGSDLEIYRSKFGLPACTTRSGCLRFVAQDGSSNLPGSNSGWAAEISVDLDMASASCPNCKLLVVEANDDTLSNLVAALDEAVTFKPTVISNSWSVPEAYASQSVSGPFSHSGVAVVAGSGDAGHAVSWPASEPSIVAVGGTTLTRANVPRGWTEAGWSEAGYGCSATFAKPSWQAQTQCGTRGVADISAVADPSTGVAIYNSQALGKGLLASLLVPLVQGGWEVYGGTSVATPIVAGSIALAGNAAQLSTPEYIYLHSGTLNPVAPGASALQAGLGSPNGTAAL